MCSDKNRDGVCTRLAELKMKLSFYSSVKKWRFASSFYVTSGIISALLGIIFLALLFGKLFLKVMVSFKTMMIPLCAGVITGAASFFCWYYMKKNGNTARKLAPLSADCPVKSFSELAQKINSRLKNSQLKKVAGVLYASEKRNRKRTRLFLFDFSGENTFDRTLINNTICEIYERLSLHIPKTNSEARNCFRLVICVFSSLPASAEDASQENAKNTLYESFGKTVSDKQIESVAHPPLSKITGYIGKAISETSLTVFVDLARGKLFMPACKTNDPATMSQYDFCIKLLSKLLLY